MDVVVNLRITVSSETPVQEPHPLPSHLLWHSWISSTLLLTYVPLLLISLGVFDVRPQTRQVFRYASVSSEHWWLHCLCRPELFAQWRTLEAASCQAWPYVWLGSSRARVTKRTPLPKTSVCSVVCCSYCSCWWQAIRVHSVFLKGCLFPCTLTSGRIRHCTFLI